MLARSNAAKQMMRKIEHDFYSDPNMTFRPPKYRGLQNIVLIDSFYLMLKCLLEL